MLPLQDPSHYTILRMSRPWGDEVAEYDVVRSRVMLERPKERSRVELRSNRGRSAREEAHRRKAMRRTFTITAETLHFQPFVYGLT